VGRGRTDVLTKTHKIKIALKKTRNKTHKTHKKTHKIKIALKKTARWIPTTFQKNNLFAYTATDIC
jgi:hypothetical protein